MATPQEIRGDSEVSPFIMDWRNGEPTPDGFHLVVLPLNDKEYQRFLRERALTAPGTVWASVRRAMGLPEIPHGIQSALRRQRRGEV